MTLEMPVCGIMKQRPTLWIRGRGHDNRQFFGDILLKRSKEIGRKLVEDVTYLVMTQTFFEKHLISQAQCMWLERGSVPYSRGGTCEPSLANWSIIFHGHSDWLRDGI